MGRIRHYLAAILLVGLTSSVVGQWCSRRGCCPGRDDDCNLPFYDTLCYCDEFCKRTDTDCCPDYYSNLCHFPSTAIPKPTPTASGGKFVHFECHILFANVSTPTHKPNTNSCPTEEVYHTIARMHNLHYVNLLQLYQCQHKYLTGYYYTARKYMQSSVPDTNICPFTRFIGHEYMHIYA